jgi:hypothetical protein
MDLDVVGVDDGVQRLDEVPVDLEGVNLGTGLDERQGQRAQARADLEDLIAGTDLGQSRDASNRVGIDDEVLTKRSRGFDPVVA